MRLFSWTGIPKADDEFLIAKECRVSGCINRPRHRVALRIPCNAEDGQEQLGCVRIRIRICGAHKALLEHGDDVYLKGGDL